MSKAFKKLDKDRMSVSESLEKVVVVTLSELTRRKAALESMKEREVQRSANNIYKLDRQIEDIDELIKKAKELGLE